MEIISSRKPIAKRDCYCMACEWITNEDITEIKLTFSEYRDIIKAKNNGYKIKQGQRYIYQLNAKDGEIWTFRAIPEIHEICIKYEIYIYN